MTMDSWFAGEDTGALNAQVEAQLEEDRKQREAQAAQAQLQGPVYGPPPSMTAAGEMQAMNTYGSVLPQMLDYLPGNEKGPWYGPAPSPAQALAGVRQELGPGIGGAVSSAASDFAKDTLLPILMQTQIGGQPIGFSQGPAAFSPPTYQQGTQAEIPYTADINQQLGNVGQAIGDPVGLGGVGRFVLGNTLPENVGDAALMAGLAGTATTPLEAVLPFDPLAAAGSVRNYADNVVRGAFSEPQLFPGLGAGVPPPGGLPWDVARLGPEPSLPDAWQAAQPELRGPVVAPQPSPQPPAALDPYDTGVAFGYNPAQPDFTSFPVRVTPAEVAPPVTGGQPAFGPGSRGGTGGLPIPPSTQPDDVMAALQRSIEAQGATPPPPDANALHQAVTDAAPTDTVSVYHTVDKEVADQIRRDGFNPGSALTPDPETARLLGANRHGADAEVLRFDVPRSSIDPESWYFTNNQRIYPTGLTGGGSTPVPPLVDAIYNSPVRERGFEVARESEVNAFVNNIERAARAMPDGPQKDDVFGAIENVRNALDRGMYDDATRFSERAISTMHREGNFIDPAGLADLRDAHDTLRQTANDLAGGGSTPNPPSAELGQVAPPPGSPPPASTTGVGAGQTTYEIQHQGFLPVTERPTPPATDVAALRDEVRQLREAVQANGAPPRWAEPPAPPTSGGGGRAAAGGGTPKGQSAIGVIRDLLYAPFGFDWSSWLRQDVMRTLNPFRLGETLQVAKDSSRAIASRDTALRLTDELKARAEALGVNMHLPDWQGGDIVGRENLYSKLLNSLPGYEALNRGFATEIASRRVNALENFAKNHPGADLQHEANRLERTTGRGSFGSGSVEKALSTVGPAFTALRYTLSIPQRTASLIPFQRLTDGSFQMFGPSWREAVIDHAGFVTTVAATMAAAQQAGFKVGWDPNNQTSNSGGKVPFGAIQLPNGTFIDLTGGAKKYVNAVMQLATGEKNGKDYPWLWEQAENGQYKGTVAEFLRNLSGPTVQFPLAAAKEAGVEGKFLEFMRPDLWDKGVTGKGTFADRAAQFVVPLWIQDVADAVRNSAKGDQLPSQIGAGAAAFFGAGVQTYERKPLDDMHEAVKNDTRLPEEIRGAEYDKLGPKGKAAEDKLAQQDNPAEYKAAQEERNQNSNPAFQKYHETTDKISQQEEQRKTDVYNMLREGKVSGEQVRMLREALNSSANAQREAARNDPDYKKALSGLERNEVGKALDAYYAASRSIPPLANGKPDYDRIAQVREAYIKAVEGKDAETGKYLRFELNTPKEKTNPLDKLYDAAQPVLQKYFGDVKDSYTRTNMRVSSPGEDALLNLLGYESKTLTPQAAQLLTQLRQNLPTTSPAPAPVAAGVQRSAVPAPPPAPPPQQTVAPLPAPTGARLPPVAPGEFNSATASPQQRTNFINAMAAPANTYSYTKIPPAVWMAMGASESNWGRAPSVFGIKGVGSAGGANLDTHEIINGKRVDMPDQFAAYNNLDDAFNHFIDLTSHGRYAGAWNYLQETGDWRGFLRGITDAGYATAKNWPDSIISLADHIQKTYNVR